MTPIRQPDADEDSACKTATGSARPPEQVLGAARCLSILEAFDAQHIRLTPAKAAELSGLTRAAARRYLITLHTLGYLDTDGKLYWLTPKVLRMSQAYLDSSRLARAAHPYLQRISAVTQEVSYASVLDGDDVIYVARNSVNRVFHTGFTLGARMPAQVTAAGMLLLAHKPEREIDAWLARRPLRRYTPHTLTDGPDLRRELADIRERGFAVSEQQIDLHFRGVAVPLRNLRGDVIGAINVTMPTALEPGEASVERTLPVLLETARDMRGMF